MKDVYMQHGTASGYKKHKCRCDRCKAWNFAAAQRFRIRGGRITKVLVPIDLLIRLKEAASSEDRAVIDQILGNRW